MKRRDRLFARSPIALPSWALPSWYPYIQRCKCGATPRKGGPSTTAGIPSRPLVAGLNDSLDGLIASHFPSPYAASTPIVTRRKVDLTSVKQTLHDRPRYSSSPVGKTLTIS